MRILKAETGPALPRIHGAPGLISSIAKRKRGRSEIKSIWDKSDGINKINLCILLVLRIKLLKCSTLGKGALNPGFSE